MQTTERKDSTDLVEYILHAWDMKERFQKKGKDFSQSVGHKIF